MNERYHPNVVKYETEDGTADLKQIEWAEVTPDGHFLSVRHHYNMQSTASTTKIPLSRVVRMDGGET